MTKIFINTTLLIAGHTDNPNSPPTRARASEIRIQNLSCQIWGVSNINSETYPICCTEFTLMILQKDYEIQRVFYKLFK